MATPGWSPWEPPSASRRPWLSAVALAHARTLSGVQVGAVVIMAAVATEALVTTLFARPVLREDVFPLADDDTPLTQRAIWQFHAPLAVTTLLTLLAQPVTSAALARLPNASVTLAAWPVTYMLLLVIRGGGLALQEITVAQARNPEAIETLREFTLLVGGLSTALTALICLTPLLPFYLGSVLHLPPLLWPLVRTGTLVALLVPLTTALSSWARGLLVAEKRTRFVYRGMGVNLGTHIALLLVAVTLKLPGMEAAAAAFTLASIAEYLYLHKNAAR